MSADSRMQRRLEQLQAQGRKALVPFVTAGDPGLDCTVATLHALAEAGADMIELGVPFSDPMADGVVIQKSSERALERGVNADYIFKSVAEFRQGDADTPVILMGYLNPIERRGWSWYAGQCAAAGVDALLIVDLPPEEAETVRTELNRQGLQLISLLAPTTDGKRLHDACSTAQGYIYYVSMAGVTGKGLEQAGSLKTRIQEIQAQAPVPVYVGFGIKDPETAQDCARFADGVIVGSALVTALSGCHTPEQCRAAAVAFLKPIRQAIDLV